MAKPLETFKCPCGPEFGLIDAVFAETRQQRLREFSGQPDHVLIFGLHPRPGFQYQPRNIGDQTNQQDSCDEQVEPGAERKRLPHDIPRSSARLTHQYTRSLILYIDRWSMSERRT